MVGETSGVSVASTSNRDPARHSFHAVRQRRTRMTVSGSAPSFERSNSSPRRSASTPRWARLPTVASFSSCSFIPMPFVPRSHAQYCRPFVDHPTLDRTPVTEGNLSLRFPPHAGHGPTFSAAQQWEHEGHRQNENLLAMLRARLLLL